ncbi:MAG: LPP20 family lipoprotein [Helicobacteraceae bacterium]|jgi:hypothetical protein|nr:LPP20 family lipoprotein [Helicobacteraceae bacterium]
MRWTALIVSAIVGFGFVACAQKSGENVAPKWIKGVSDYPASRYITGIGGGATQEIAADNARNDLAKTIGVSVESSTRSQTSAAHSGKYESAFSSAVNVRASQTIVGAEIADRYYDEASQIYYALAVLDRAKSAMRLAAQLSQKEIEIDALLKEANDESDALNKLRALNGAKTALDDRREIAAVLAAIDVAPPSAYLGESDVLTQRRAALRSVKFSVGGDYEGKKLLAEAIGAAGFTLADQSKSDYQAIGYFKNVVRAENGWQWANAILEIEIVDYEYGATRHSFNFEVKESSQNAETAKARALERMRSELPDKLMYFIVSAPADAHSLD